SVDGTLMSMINSVRAMAKTPSLNASSRALACASAMTRLYVELFGLFRPLHDELEPRARILSHQFIDDAIGHDLIRNLHLQEPPRARIERRLPQDLRHHLAETLEARDLRLGPSVRALQNRILVRVVERPMRLFANVDAVERRLREIHLAVADELRHMAVDE